MTEHLHDTEPAALSLRDYVGVLRRRKWIVIVVTGAAVAIALALSALQTPVYEAKAQLVLRSGVSDTLFDPTTGAFRADPARQVETQIEVIESDVVRERVEDDLGRSVADVDATPVDGTDSIEIAVRGTDAAAARATVDAYGTAYVEVRREQAVEDLTSAATKLQDRIAQLQAELAAIPVDDPARAAERASRAGQITVFQDQINQLTAAAALRTGGADVVTPAAVPGSPVEPRPLRNAALAGIVGLLLGVAIAFLRDHLDDRARTADDVARVTGLAVVGAIPDIRAWRNAEDRHIVAIKDPQAAESEAYRTLRTSIQFAALDAPIQLLQVTSAISGEGKSTTSANLAVVLANAGVKTLLVDCDLRRPSIHQFFGIDNHSGFTSILLAGVTPESAAIRVMRDQPLWVLPTGPIPPNPSELLSSEVGQKLLERLRESWEMIIIDSPPVLPVTDAQIIAAHADATLLVVGLRSVSTKELRHTVEALDRVNARLLGAVGNRATESRGSGYGYTYGYRSRYHEGPALLDVRDDGLPPRIRRERRVTVT